MRARALMTLSAVDCGAQRFVGMMYNEHVERAREHACDFSGGRLYGGGGGDTVAHNSIEHILQSSGTWRFLRAHMCVCVYVAVCALFVCSNVNRRGRGGRGFMHAFTHTHPVSLTCVLLTRPDPVTSGHNGWMVCTKLLNARPNAPARLMAS